RRRNARRARGHGNPRHGPSANLPTGREEDRPWLSLRGAERQQSNLAGFGAQSARDCFASLAMTMRLDPKHACWCFVALVLVVLSATALGVAEDASSPVDPPAGQL